MTHSSAAPAPAALRVLHLDGGRRQLPVIPSARNSYQATAHLLFQVFHPHSQRVDAALVGGDVEAGDWWHWSAARAITGCGASFSQIPRCNFAICCSAEQQLIPERERDQCRHEDFGNIRYFLTQKQHKTHREIVCYLLTDNILILKTQMLLFQQVSVFVDRREKGQNQTKGLGENKFYYLLPVLSSRLQEATLSTQRWW